MSEKDKLKNDDKMCKVEDEISEKDPKKVQTEDQTTAAWADVKCKTKDAKVTIPSEEAVEDAQDWISENKR